MKGSVKLLSLFKLLFTKQVSIPSLPLRAEYVLNSHYHKIGMV